CNPGQRRAIQVLIVNTGVNIGRRYGVNFPRRLTRKDIILPDIRLNEKLRHVVKRNLPTNLNGLNGLRVWGEVFSRFNQITETRNAIAHNTKIAAITKDDVKVCFSTLAIIVAIVQEQCFDEAAILECYGLS
ncbi:hypothetical protein ACQZ6I_24665, partial [Agrobacterium vitis]